MFKAVIEDYFGEPEYLEETTFPASDHDLLILTQRLCDQNVPTKVFMQAIAIAAYDGAAAFRYADNYFNKVRTRRKRKNSLWLKKPVCNFEQN